jgi:hypothetical protein
MLEEDAGGTSTLTLPATFGDFTLRDHVADDLCGSVFRAEFHNRTVAVLILRDGAELEPAVLERFLRLNSARIRHPNLQTVEAYGRHEGSDYLAAQFLRGDALAAVLADLRAGRCQRPSFSPVAVGADGDVHPAYICHAVETIAHLAEGLGRAHAEGLVHGRLSPRCLFFSPTGRLVASGFGVRPGCRLDEDRDGLAYRAPEEVASGDFLCDARGDVYALGAVLYELVTSRPPFAAESSAALQRSILAGQLRPPRELKEAVPVHLEDMLLTAMAMAPEARYSSAAGFADDLRRYLRGEAPRARRIQAAHDALGEVRRPRLPRAPRRWLRIGVAVALALLLAAAADAGRRLQAHRTKREVQTAALDLETQGEVIRALSEAERLVAMDPSDPGAEALRRSLAQSAAARHLVGAASAIEAGDLSAAARDLAAAGRFAPSSKELSELRVRVETESRRDPLARDAEDPRPAVRLEALRDLRSELRRGGRRFSDLSSFAGALHDPDAAVRELAFAVFALSPSSAPLLEALPLEGGGGRVSIDAASFLAALRALATIGDTRSSELLCLWTLDDMERLDHAEAPEEVELPPAVVVLVEEASPRLFTAAWVRAAPALDPAGFLETLPRLIGREDLASPLIAALGELRNREAAEALAQLARRRFLSHGSEAIEALVRAGGRRLLLELARDRRLPVEYRRRVIEALGGSFAADLRPELADLVATEPESILRQAAFSALERFDGRDGWSPRRVILAAIDDPPLRERALGWLDRLEPTLCAEVALELVAHRRPQVRERAGRILAADRGLERVPSLVLHALSTDPGTRRASLEALRKREDLAEIAARLREAAGELWSRAAAVVQSVAGRLRRGASAETWAEHCEELRRVLGR